MRIVQPFSQHTPLVPPCPVPLTTLTRTARFLVVVATHLLCCPLLLGLRSINELVSCCAAVAAAVGVKATAAQVKGRQRIALIRSRSPKSLLLFVPSNERGVHRLWWGLNSLRYDAERVLTICTRAQFRHKLTMV